MESEQGDFSDDGLGDQPPHRHHPHPPHRHTDPTAHSSLGGAGGDLLSDAPNLARHPVRTDGGPQVPPPGFGGEAGCAMRGWVQLETYQAAEGPEEAVLYKSRWFELWGDSLIHFSRRREPGGAGYPGDIIPLGELAVEPNLSLKLCLSDGTVAVLHTDSPGDWLEAITTAGPAAVLSQEPDDTAHLSTFGDYSIKQLLLTNEVTVCSFGSIRRAALSGHHVAARLISPKFLVRKQTSRFLPLEGGGGGASAGGGGAHPSAGEIDMQPWVETTRRCKYLNTIHYATTTRSRKGGAGVQGWVVADWLPHTLRGCVGEERAKHQIAQLAEAVNQLEQDGLAPHGGVHPCKIRLDKSHCAVLTGVGIRTIYSRARRRSAELSPFHSPDGDDDWFSLGAVLHYLLTGRPPEWEGGAPHQGGSLVPPEGISPECLRCLEGLLLPGGSRITGLAALKREEFFRGFDWMFCLPVPPPAPQQQQQQAFRVVELESPARRVRAQASVSVAHPRQMELASCGTSSANPRGVVQKGASGSTSLPLRVLAHIAKPTLSSSERQVESLAKAVALKRHHERGRDGNPAMKYSVDVVCGRRVQRVRSAAGVRVEAGEQRGAQQRRPAPSGPAVPRNCAVNLLESAHLNTLHHIEPHLLQGPSKGASARSRRAASSTANTNATARSLSRGRRHAPSGANLAPRDPEGTEADFARLPVSQPHLHAGRASEGGLAGSRASPGGGAVERRGGSGKAGGRHSSAKAQQVRRNASQPRGGRGGAGAAVGQDEAEDSEEGGARRGGLRVRSPPRHAH